MSTNAFQRLAALRPDAPVLVGRVLRHNTDDTSDIELPTGVSSVGANGVVHGAIIRARGTNVPVNSWAFVRRGLVETQAPSGTARVFGV
jgi:hypothetical protein